MKFKLLALAGALLGTCACGTTPEPQAPKPALAMGVAKGADLSRCDFKGRKDRAQILTRGPGADEPNIERVFEFNPDSKVEARTLRCRLLDTNLDGVRDVVRTYTEKGEPLDEQADTDYDQRIDTWVRFSRGRVIREVHDRNGDGKPDENRLYSAGKLSRVQRDRNGDGRLDAWEVYDGDRLHRVGVDLDGDQRVDRWYRDEQLKRRAEQAAAAEAKPPAAATAPATAPEASAEKSTPPEPAKRAEPPAAGAKPAATLP